MSRSAKLKGTRHPFIIIPESGVRVATFDNLYQSIASYLHNLNTNRAYARLRAERAAIRRKYGKLSGSYLAGALLHYSDRGQDYVNTLRKLIAQHKLDELDNLQFDNNGPTTLIRFKR